MKTGLIRKAEREINEITAERIGFTHNRMPVNNRIPHSPDNTSSDSKDVESVWEKEITDRILAVDDGTAIGLDYDAAMRELEKRFSS